MTTQSSPRITRSPLFVETWEGVLTRLRDMYSAKSNVTGKDINVLPCANPDALERMLQIQASPLELPVVGVGIVNVEPNVNSFNTTVMRRVGYQIMVDDTRDSWYMLKTAPVILTYQVTIVSDDVMTMLRMVDRWMSTENWGFRLVVDGSSKIVVPVVIEADKNIAVPPLTPGVGGSDQYRLTTNLKVQTYSGYLWRVPSVREFVIDVKLSKVSDIQLAVQDPEKYGIDVLEKLVMSVDLEPKF